MFFRTCNSCGDMPNVQMPQFEIVRPCCFRPRGGVFLIRQTNCGCGNGNDRQGGNDRSGCGCGRR